MVTPVFGTFNVLAVTGPRDVSLGGLLNRPLGSLAFWGIQFSMSLTAKPGSGTIEVFTRLLGQTAGGHLATITTIWNLVNPALNTPVLFSIDPGAAPFADYIWRFGVGNTTTPLFDFQTEVCAVCVT